jgi:hypothetical protein
MMKTFLLKTFRRILEGARSRASCFGVCPAFSMLVDYPSLTRCEFRALSLDSVSSLPSLPSFGALQNHDAASVLINIVLRQATT